MYIFSQRRDRETEQQRPEETGQRDRPDTGHGMASEASLCCLPAGAFLNKKNAQTALRSCILYCIFIFLYFFCAMCDTIMIYLSPLSLSVGLVIVTVTWWLLCRETRNLPPMAKAPLSEIIEASSTQEGVTQLVWVQNLCEGINRDKDPNSTGNTTYGSIARINIPFQTMMYCSDFKLGRLILIGDSAHGVKEGEKSRIMRLFNFFDFQKDNMISHLTANRDRYASRKCIATSFSMVNLYKRVPEMEASIAETMKEFQRCAETGELLDVKKTILALLIRSLSRSAFGVNIVLGRKANEDEIDGEKYLGLLDVVLREAAKRGMDPVRSYKFWSPECQEYNAAAKELEAMTGDILLVYLKKNPGGMCGGEPDTSILGNIARHEYKSERERLSDLVLFVIAGHETTTYSILHLLLDLVKHPASLQRLQSEFEKYMPADPPSKRDPLGPDDIVHMCSGLNKHDYFNRCIKESMRLWPVAAGGSARDLVEDIHYEGMVLPKGSTVFVHYYALNRAPWIHQRDEFIPDRWLSTDPQATELKELSFPFSLGQRACIGQNMAMLQLRIMAATILRHYNLTLPESAADQPEYEYFISLKIKSLKMHISARV